MIEFLNIEYKNLNSIGNQPIKIELNRSPNTLIGGHNGAGKSSLGYAISFCLFGKFLNGIKLAQAINSTNKKNLLTTIEFRKNGVLWKVVRGEKPKKFEIYKDDSLLDQYANTRDQQVFLEKILGMDYKLFTQIVVLNKERYVPFMEMVPADRRKIIEDLLDISIFTVMNDILKNKSALLKNKLSALEHDLSIKNSESTYQDRLIKQIEETIENSNNDKQKILNEKNNQLQSLIDDNNKILSEYDKIDISDQEEVKKRKNEYQKLATQFDIKLKTYKENKTFFSDNEICPTCEQEIDDEIKSKKVEESDEKILEINNVVVDLLSEMEKIISRSNKISELKNNQNELMTVMNANKRNIDSIERDIKNILEKQTDNDIKEKLNNTINEKNSIMNDIKLLESDINEIYILMEVHETTKVLLRDDGIKAIIIKEYINLMNSKINEYLNAMNFYINMNLDENFNETFGAINKENFSYENLSSGQKTRVNFAIYLALTEIASIKNSVVTNLLFLDEIFENIDGEGIKDVMILIKEKLESKNTFVVTQRFDEFFDMFYSSIKFKQNINGFTEIIS